MGQVFRARDLADDSVVALKRLAPSLTAQARMRRRFDSEAQALSAIRVAGVPRFVAAGLTHDGAPFIAMEWVAGRSLMAHARGGGVRTLAQAAAIADGLLQMVSAMHEQGWAHGDIKAGNVLVAPDRGGGEKVALIDLGLARRLGGADSGAEVEEVCGTPEYMAPEMASGAPASVASDLYAVGTLLYELVAGAPPFEGSSPVSVLLKQAVDEVVPPSLRCENRLCTPAIDGLVRRALAKDPAERFPSAREMRTELAAAMAVFAQDPAVWLSPPHASHGEDVTRPLTSEDVRGAPELDRSPTAPSALTSLRARLGEALALGRPDAALDEYLRLTHALERLGDHDAARQALEEAVHVMTFAPGPPSAPGSAYLWRILLELATVENLAGRTPRALAIARHALHHARRASCEDGVRRALELCRRLGPEATPALALAPRR